MRVPGETEEIFSRAAFLKVQSGNHFAAPTFSYAAISFFRPMPSLWFFRAGWDLAVVGLVFSAFFAATFFLALWVDKTLPTSAQKSKSPSRRMPVCSVIAHFLPLPSYQSCEASDASGYGC
jgi:hypothetical protein